MSYIYPYNSYSSSLTINKKEFLSKVPRIINIIATKIPADNTIFILFKANFNYPAPKRLAIIEFPVDPNATPNKKYI